MPIQIYINKDVLIILCSAAQQPTVQNDFLIKNNLLQKIDELTYVYTLCFSVVIFTLYRNKRPKGLNGHLSSIAYT